MLGKRPRAARWATFALCSLSTILATGCCSTTPSPRTVVVRPMLPAQLRPTTPRPPVESIRDASELVAVDRRELEVLLGRTAKLAAGWQGLDPEDVAHLHGEALEAAERVQASLIVGKGRYLVERQALAQLVQRLREADRYWSALEVVGQWERPRT